MFTYEIDGKQYTYDKEIGQEEAEKRVRAFNERVAQATKARTGGSYEERFSNVAVWNTVMPSYEYSLQKWYEFITA